jgi:hypothetical protein
MNEKIQSAEESGREKYSSSYTVRYVVEPEGTQHNQPTWHMIEEAPEIVRAVWQIQTETPGDQVRLFHGPDCSLYVIHSDGFWKRLPNYGGSHLTVSAADASDKERGIGRLR